MGIQAVERILFADSETTGFDPKAGDRMIEAGFVEYVDRKPTGRTLHVYMDPKRDVPEEAQAVHGLSRDDLVKLSKGKIFADHAPELIDFIKGATLVFHNAPFDVKFFDAEFQIAGYGPLSSYCDTVIDSLQVANLKFPGQQNSLDALLRRLVGVGNYSRDLHGALLDADLLGKVYNIMTVAQVGLGLDRRLKPTGPTLNPQRLETDLSQLIVRTVDDVAMEKHRALSERIKKTSGGSLIELSFG